MGLRNKDIKPLIDLYNAYDNLYSELTVENSIVELDLYYTIMNKNISQLIAFLDKKCYNTSYFHLNCMNDFVNLLQNNHKGQYPLIDVTINVFSDLLEKLSKILGIENSD